jgi:hypothetical protein
MRIPSASERSVASPWRVEITLFALVVVSHGYFFGGLSWNQSARFDAIFSFVEPGPDSGTFRIDRFLRDADGRLPEPAEDPRQNTGDWSFYPPEGKTSQSLDASAVRGHYYANKAPGPILLGTAVYFVIYRLERLVGADPLHHHTRILNFYLINLFISVGITGLGLVAFRRLLLACGAGERRAICFSLVLGFATMLFPYDTQLWGHPTAAAFVVIGVLSIFRGSAHAITLGGFFAGMAALCDYPAAVIVVALGIFALVRYRNRAGFYIVGGLLPLAAFMLYHNACFGSPFALATDYTNPTFVDERLTLGGFGIIDLQIFGKLLAGIQRGLLFQMPVLTLSLAGIAYWLKRHRRDGLAWLSIGVLLALLAMNSSFNGWHGGASVCARYQIIALPFWVICMKEVPWRGIWRVAFPILAGISALNMLAVSAVSPLVPESHPEPLYSWVYGQHLLQGNLSWYNSGFWADERSFWNCFNLGMIAGLRGIWSLLPLLAMSTAGALGIIAATCRPKRMRGC